MERNIRGVDVQPQQDPNFMAASMLGSKGIDPFAEDCRVDDAEFLGLPKERLYAGGETHYCVIIEYEHECVYVYASLIPD